MPKRDLYRLLGVSNSAAAGEIRRAYRRIAFSAHPDVGEHPDAERFREAHEAYRILSDPARRRTYDGESSIRRRPAPAEPIRTHSPMGLREDFMTVRPSLAELLDHLERKFLGSVTKSGGQMRRLRVQAILNPEEAHFGCRVPFTLPRYFACPRCGGGRVWWALCPACYGRGVVEAEQELTLEIPPGARHGERFEVDLRDAGIANLILEVKVAIAP